MDGVTAVRVIREITVVKYQPDTIQPVTIVSQTTVPPPPQKNHRCLNALILLIIYTVGIGSIILGARYTDKCPAVSVLTVCVTVFGVLVIGGQVLFFVPDILSVCNEEKTVVPTWFMILKGGTMIFEFVVFIPICYWVFSISPSNNPRDSDDYCDHTFYKTTFYGCIAWLIFCGLSILCGCCMYFFSKEIYLKGPIYGTDDF